ncbi:hypothetical protein HanPSC8_Chr06g0233681 [Helianthus annuus]|nr:hypothetical protein HanPSC8_Chr06g0233681 [Helianthus annuus]
MNSVSLTTACNSCTLPQLQHLFTLHHHPHKSLINQRRIRKGRCKAALAHDAPFVVAMGACVLNSLVFPLPMSPNDDEESNSVIDSADARFAVMGIISFIPYFNWMSWVFAWMDTGDKRYVVYAIVYLAPYLRSNLSLSPDESWLPIASIILCILHIQVNQRLIMLLMVIVVTSNYVGSAIDTLYGVNGHLGHMTLLDVTLGTFVSGDIIQPI